MPSIAQVETARLLLREQRPGDAAAWAPFLSDPDFRRYIPVRRSSEAPEQRAERSIAALMARWQGEPLTAMGWVITRRSDGQVIGTGGVDAGEEPGDAEIDYFLGKPFWGQGYGREAAHAMSRFALDNTACERLVAYVVPANIGSIRIAESLGLRYERQVDYLKFFPDPSMVELADSMTNVYAARRADVTLDGGHYRVLDGSAA